MSDIIHTPKKLHRASATLFTSHNQDLTLNITQDLEPGIATAISDITGEHVT